LTKEAILKSTPLVEKVNYLKVHVPKATYYTSVTTKPLEDFEPILTTNPYSKGVKENYFFAPDFKFQKEYNLAAANYLMSKGIKSNKISLIVAADNVVRDKQAVFNLEKFLEENRLDQVIVAKGSSSHALTLQPVDSQYQEVAKLVQKYNQKLALIANPYQPVDIFREDIRRKEYLGPNVFMSQPILNPGVLQPGVKEMYEEWMKDPKRGVSIGVLSNIDSIYSNRMLAITDSRVTSRGEDRYMLPDWPQGMSQEEYFRTNASKTLDWISMNMQGRSIEDLERAIYTRVGIGHGESHFNTVVNILKGTEFDASTSNQFGITWKKKIA
jgi:hypothetical protein